MGSQPVYGMAPPLSTFAPLPAIRPREGAAARPSNTVLVNRAELVELISTKFAQQNILLSQIFGDVGAEISEVLQIARDNRRMMANFQKYATDLLAFVNSERALNNDARQAAVRQSEAFLTHVSDMKSFCELLKGTQHDLMLSFWLMGDSIDTISDEQSKSKVERLMQKEERQKAEDERKLAATERRNALDRYRNLMKATSGSSPTPERKIMPHRMATRSRPYPNHPSPKAPSSGSSAEDSGNTSDDESNGFCYLGLFTYPDRKEWYLMKRQPRQWSFAKNQLSKNGLVLLMLWTRLPSSTNIAQMLRLRCASPSCKFRANSIQYLDNNPKDADTLHLINSIEEIAGKGISSNYDVNNLNLGDDFGL